MGLSGGTALPTLILIVTLGVLEPALTRNPAVIGKKEAISELNVLRKLHESHIQKRSVQSEIDDEETEIDLNLLKRVLDEMEEEERGVRMSKTTPSPIVNGEELIQEALKGNVDPDSEVVDLIESMFVDQGSRHNQHPDGIEKIASKKGKVYGDTHDGHRWTKQQLEELNNSGGRKRNFDKTATLWTEKIIPYTIDSSLSDNQAYVDVINEAVKQFSDYTCLRWVPRGSPGDTATYSSYIEFFSESGCWSYVGRVFDGKQQISLQAPFCVSLSTTIHEMAHAIGQQHEQSRNDRDNHVTMMWSNILGGENNTNMKKSDTHDNNPYDYESVLQYSLNSFSNGNGPAMVFKDQRLNFLADSATGLMFYDIQDITDAYNCSAPCKGPNGDQPLKQCQNGGFVLHTCNCHCPDGLTGTLCETVVTDPVCGQGIINLADGESRTITSPNFDKGGSYPTGKNCVWLIKVPTGKHVGLIINQMDLTSENGACDHWLEIQYNLIGQTGPRRCGKLSSSEQYITSPYGTPQIMLLKFDSAFAASATAGQGFNLTVSAVGAGCLSAPCIQGTCSDSECGGYSCKCDDGFTGTHCDFYAGTGDILCDFENETCVFRNSPLMKNAWIRHQGTTRSSDTGPSKAVSGMYYLYAESSSPVASGSKFHFESSYIKAGSRCLTFWYHMYGSDMGSLNVLRNGTQVWTRSGDQGDTWYRAEVDIGTAGQNYNITFEAVRGTSNRSDIAIDDILLTSSACALPTTPTPSTDMPTTQVPTTETSTGIVPTPGQTIFRCTFESIENKCFLSNVQGTDDFDWSRAWRRNPTKSTGPDAAFEGIYFGYMEASTCSLNDRAIFESPPIPMPYETVCLSFAYHMYGRDIGALSVLYENFTYFHMSGDKGNQWRKANATLRRLFHMVDHKVQFIGTCGDGRNGDIAIDDVRVTRGKCVHDCSGLTCGQNAVCIPDPSHVYRCECLPGFSGLNCTTVTGQTNCTFEDGDSCFLENSTQDDFDWTIRSGKISSRDTGPSSASEGLKYAYVEVSGKKDGAVASLESTINVKAGYRCLVFDYRMYGVSIDSLRVLKKFPDESVKIFPESWEQNSPATDWRTSALNVYHHEGIKIVFEARSGNSSKGNIAIDNIRYIPNFCGCDVMVCLNGGTCKKIFRISFCSCPPSYKGERCETKVLDCSDLPCGQNAVCISDPSQVYRCECLPGFSGLNCTTVTGQINCTFEDGDSCFLENSTQDDFDWTIRSGKTPSRDTGPSSASEGLKYAYIDVSGKKDGALASLESTFNVKVGPRCLAFDYHMYGVSIGSLRVLKKGNDGPIVLLSKSGQRSSSATDWKTFYVDTYHFDGDKIVFEAKSGNSFKGDIAIDNVRYNPGFCGCDVASCLNGGTCLDTDFGVSCLCPPPYTGQLCHTIEGMISSCTFDDDDSPSCLLPNVKGDDLDWIIGSGATPSIGTGPSQSLEGNYAYIQASGPHTGKKALLSSERFILVTSGPACLSFYYNMHGLDMGTLNVWAGDRSAKTKVWTLSGDQGDVWTPVEVQIPASKDLVIVFEGVCGSGNKSEIAIDTIQVFRKPCAATTSATSSTDFTSLPGTPPTAAPIGLMCSFEPNTSCFLKDVQGSDNLNWSRISGKTPSLDTGPDGAAEGSFYAYIEASGKRQGAQAIMESEPISLSSGTTCLTFAYHMYGADIDSLEVLYANQRKFYEMGNKGNNWKRVQVVLTCKEYPTSGKIQFIATLGIGFRADIAVDDIQVTQGQCPPYII